MKKGSRFDVVPEAHTSVPHRKPVGEATADLANSEEPAVGSSVLIHGLKSATSYNDKFATIEGFDKQTGRFMVKAGPHMPAIKAKRANLVYPALCPVCTDEVTSNCCFNCGYGGNATRHDACFATLSPPQSGEQANADAHLSCTPSAIAEHSVPDRTTAHAGSCTAEGSG